jgi:hypothetical protein
MLSLLLWPDLGSIALVLEGRRPADSLVELVRRKNDIHLLRQVAYPRMAWAFARCTSAMGSSFPSAAMILGPATRTATVLMQARRLGRGYPPIQAGEVVLT